MNYIKHIEGKVMKDYKAVVALQVRVTEVERNKIMRYVHTTNDETVSRLLRRLLREAKII